MANQPYLALYTGDWKKDPELSLCSPATRGIWIDLLCSLHDGRIGQVTGNAAQLSRLCRCDAAEMHASLLELQSTGAAVVSERAGLFTVICRRMKKAADISELRKQAGSKNRAKPKPNPDIDIGNEIGLKKRLGDLFRRKENTPWSEKELAALRFCNLKDPLTGNRWASIDEDDLAAVERYYREDIPKERDYRRRDLLTLLNNWNGEVDRARARLPKQIPRAGVNPQPARWLAWLKQNYPDATQKDYWKAPGDVQGEFKNRQNEQNEPNNSVDSVNSVKPSSSPVSL